MTYRYGSFTWFDLFTTDIKKAQAFYGELFNWTIEDFKMDEGNYAMACVGGQSFGGYMDAPKGMPAMWVPHLSVEDVDARIEKVKEAGGKLMQGPFDLSGIGRGAAITSATGAGMSVFHSETGDPEPATGPGSVSWNELWSADLEKDKDFLADAFGFSYSSMEMPDMTYWMMKPGPADSTGGLLQSPVKEMPSMWLTYFEVENCEDTIAKAKKLGGEAMGEVQAAPGVGHFATLKGATGEMFGVIAPES